MSKSTFGWRQAGFTAVATALVFGGTLVGAGAASAAIGTPAFAAIATPAGVLQGANNQAASSVNYSFDNTFAAGDKVVFDIQPNGVANVCAAGAPAAIEFSAAPTVTLTRTSTADANVRVPSYTSALSSSSLACAGEGIQDVLTVTLTQVPAGDTTTDDRINAAITAIQYNVGTTAPLGNVNFTAGALTRVNAVVADRNFSFIPREAALPNSSNNALGTATYTETTAGAFFKPGQTSQVSLTLSDGNFTAGVTPTINAPAGYTVTRAATGGSNNYTFTVAAPATAAKAVLTVAGLRADADSTIQVVNLTSGVTSLAFNATDVTKALNVVDYGNSNRLGGDTRYDTAAALFNATLASPGFTFPGSVVLSGGQLFPDALSANYLAGALGTATLLTPAKTLSPAARNAILDSDADLVYITGDTAAVSQGIQDQIESLHAGNNPSAKLISTKRLGGDTRYDTNKIVNNFADSLNGDPTPTVLLSSGENFPDALAFGPIAYGNQYPLVLTKGASLSAQASSQLAGFDPNNVVISGQTDAVSSGVASSVSATGATVSRLGGDNRSETATMIATWATTGVPTATAGTILAGDQGFYSSVVNFTWTGTPQGFGDALAAGPLAGHEGSVILLAASPTAPGDAVTGYLGLKDVETTNDGTNAGTLRPLGGTDVTSNTLMKASAASIEIP